MRACLCASARACVGACVCVRTGDGGGGGGSCLNITNVSFVSRVFKNDTDFRLTES